MIATRATVPGRVTRRDRTAHARERQNTNCTAVVVVVVIRIKREIDAIIVSPCVRLICDIVFSTRFGFLCHDDDDKRTPISFVNIVKNRSA